MRLIGYIKPFKPTSFSIPIYEQNGAYHYHKLDESTFRIIKFEPCQIGKLEFINYSTDLSANIGDYGIIVFSNKSNQVSIGNADKIIGSIKIELEGYEGENSYILEEVNSVLAILDAAITKKGKYHSATKKYLLILLKGYFGILNFHYHQNLSMISN